MSLSELQTLQQQAASLKASATDVVDERKCAAYLERRAGFLAAYKRYFLKESRSPASLDSLVEDLEESLWSPAFHTPVSALRSAVVASRQSPTAQAHFAFVCREAAAFLSRADTFFKQLIRDIQSELGTLAVEISGVQTVSLAGAAPPTDATIETVCHVVARMLVYLGDLQRYLAEMTEALQAAKVPDVPRRFVCLGQAWLHYQAAASLHPRDGRASMQAAALLSRQLGPDRHALALWYGVRAVGAVAWRGQETAIRNLSILVVDVVRANPAVRHVAEDVASVLPLDTASLMRPAASASVATDAAHRPGAAPTDAGHAPAAQAPRAPPLSPVDPLGLGSAATINAPPPAMGLVDLRESHAALDAAWCGFTAALWSRLPPSLAWALCHAALRESAAALQLPDDKLPALTGVLARSSEGAGNTAERGPPDVAPTAFDLGRGLVPHAMLAVFAHWDASGGFAAAVAPRPLNRGAASSGASGSARAEALFAARAGRWVTGDTAALRAVAACAVLHLAAQACGAVFDRGRPPRPSGSPLAPALHALLRYIALRADDLLPSSLAPAPGASGGSAPWWVVCDEAAVRYLVEAWGALAGALFRALSLRGMVASMGSLAAILGDGDAGVGVGWAGTPEGVALQHFGPLRRGPLSAAAVEVLVRQRGAGSESRAVRQRRVSSILAMAARVGQALAGFLRRVGDAPFVNDTDSTPAGLGARLRVSLSSLWARAATLARAAQTVAGVECRLGEDPFASEEGGTGEGQSGDGAGEQEGEDPAPPPPPPVVVAEGLLRGQSQPAPASNGPASGAPPPPFPGALFSWEDAPVERLERPGSPRPAGNDPMPRLRAAVGMGSSPAAAAATSPPTPSPPPFPRVAGEDPAREFIARVLAARRGDSASGSVGPSPSLAKATPGGNGPSAAAATRDALAAVASPGGIEARFNGSGGGNGSPASSGRARSLPPWAPLAAVRGRGAPGPSGGAASDARDESSSRRGRESPMDTGTPATSGGGSGAVSQPGNAVGSGGAQGMEWRWAGEGGDGRGTAWGHGWSDGGGGEVGAGAGIGAWAQPTFAAARDDAGEGRDDWLHDIRMAAAEPDSAELRWGAGTTGGGLEGRWGSAVWGAAEGSRLPETGGHGPPVADEGTEEEVIVWGTGGGGVIGGAGDGLAVPGRDVGDGWMAGAWGDGGPGWTSGSASAGMDLAGALAAAGLTQAELEQVLGPGVRLQTGKDLEQAIQAAQRRLHDALAGQSPWE